MSIINKPIQAGTSFTFTGTSTIQTLQLPDGVRLIEVYIWGSGGRSGGAGGFVSGKLAVVPKQTLQIIVGVVSDINGAVLAKGGGGGYQNFRNVGFGGGFSGVFSAFPTQATALAIAGGGGGGTGRAGGGGGYPSGGNGTANGGNAGGGGGTQTAGGAGSGGIAESGSALTGGDGNGANDFSAGSGGGGWFGGGGGRNGSGAGGGSSYIDKLIDATFENGGSGTSVTGPAQTNPYWQSPAGNTNSPGLVVIVYANIFPFYNVIRSPNNLPTTIPGCELWLDANDPSNTGIVPSNGATVSTWVDKSGNSRNMTAFLAGTGSITFSTYGGIASILFNSTSPNTAYMRVNSPVNLETFTVFAVSRCQTARNNQNALLAIPLTLPEFDSPDGFGMFIDSDVVNRRDRFYATRVANVVNNSNPAGTDAYPLRMMCWTATAIATVLRSWFNGNTGSTSSTAQSRTKTATGFGIGFDITGSGGTPTNITCVSQFSEFIVYNNVLTTAQRQLIEGYLALKWGLQSSLPASHPYRRTIPLTLTMKLFSPAKFSGLKLWLDAADPATTILSGSNVIQWRDKSANNFVASNVGPSNVQYTPNGFNGSPALSFNSNTYMDVTTTIGLLSGGMTAFMVYDRSSVALAQTALIEKTNPTSFVPGPFQFWTRSGGPNRRLIGNGTAYRQYTLTNGFSFESVGKYLYAFTATTGLVWTDYVNGSEFTPSSSATFTSGSPAFVDNYATLRVGYGGFPGGTLNARFDGFIAEIIVYSGILTIDQRQQVEGYLAWKWGLRSSLPNSNFYKFYQPAP
jgi:hypothetical protein